VNNVAAGEIGPGSRTLTPAASRSGQLSVKNARLRSPVAAGVTEVLFSSAAKTRRYSIGFRVVLSRERP